MSSAELVDLRGLARQMRCTLETEGPLAMAMPHELQCAGFSGKLSKVFTMTASVRSSSIDDGAPRRAAHPFVVRQNRRRHLQPFSWLTAGDGNFLDLQIQRTFKNAANARAERNSATAIRICDHSNF